MVSGFVEVVRVSTRPSLMPYVTLAKADDSALELGLNEHAANPVLAPTYDPAVLARSDSLAQDITFLLAQLPASITGARPTGEVPKGPLPPFALPPFLLPVFTQPPKALTTYLSHLKHLASSGKTAPGLLAHSYVRYLGDLSGGQFIMAKIRRAYNLEGLDGLRFYHFDLQGQSEGADDSRADGKRRASEVKDWFRKGMDEGVGEDENLKGELRSLDSCLLILHPRNVPFGIPFGLYDGVPWRDIPRYS